MADQLVRIRISGPAKAVAAAADRLQTVLRVAEESRDYPNDRGRGVRRYLDVLVPAEDVPAGGARRDG